MKNSFDSIVDSIIYYTGLITLGTIFIIIVFNLNEL